MTTILTKKKDTAGAPAAGDLTNAAGGAELAVNTATKRLYSKDSGGNVIEIGTNPSGTTMAGNLLFSPDNTYDIGASGATRPRTLYLGTSLITPAITDSGNLTFTGTGNRITGDFSNATIANRVAFQTSTTNGNTDINVLPNGTALQSQFSVQNNSDPTNSGRLTFLITSTEATVRSGISGTGTYLPMTFYTGGSERVRIDTSGNVGIGTSSPSSFGSPLSVYFATNPTLSIVSGNANAYLRLYSTSDNNMYLTNTGGSMTMNTANTERMRIDSTGNVGIGLTPTASVGALQVTGGIFATSTQYVGAAGSTAFSGGIQNLSNTSRSISIEADPTNAGANSLMYFNVDGTTRMAIDSSGNVGIGVTPTAALGALQVTTGTNGTAAKLGNGAFVQSFNGDGYYSGSASLDSSGVWTARSTGSASIGALAAGTILFYTNTSLTSGSTFSPTERMRIDSSGRVGINTTTTTRAILNIDTDGSNNAAGYGLALTNTAGGGATWTLQCGDQGVNNAAFTIRQTGISGTTRLKLGTDGYLTVPGVYALTTGSAANVFVDSNGILQRSTSSLKYKTDIQDATHGLAEVMQLRPVIYKGINDGETVFGGFIAEEVDALGLTEFVQYANDESPDALAYGNMVSLCVKAIQEQQALIESLTARITALESN